MSIETQIGAPLEAIQTSHDASLHIETTSSLDFIEQAFHAIIFNNFDSHTKQKCDHYISSWRGF
jgi:hypothetical protein